MSRLEFEPGLTCCRVPSARSPILHELVCSRLAETAGTAYWIDAGNVASTRVLYDCASSPRVLDSLRIARSFTAYQHHSIVRRVVEKATPRTSVIVAPNVVGRYRDDDVPAWEREELLAATLETLAELGRALEVPVLVTAASDAAEERVTERADHRVECIRTREGVRLEGDGAETMGYWQGAYWQTTIPYWVDCCGVADRIDPVVAAADRGLFDAAPEPGGSSGGSLRTPETEASS
ncbi:hypothetical protein EL22_16315 [Halostagnicola sp. A56]|uniref:hypothetical protein n=1 Tax=Halostagnicola sp. A56 TaxID=1495067 RepID=UPI0004A092AD|nr:hypothetical protein [Halostagnicola sp. A56]KDE59859.1 hypothetical protein EL22_16315 [Halostagnicola sp. A56]